MTFKGEAGENPRITCDGCRKLIGREEDLTLDGWGTLDLIEVRTPREVLHFHDYKCLARFGIARLWPKEEVRA